jgi:hypothetical protein
MARPTRHTCRPADGTYVTVKFDKDFNVIGREQGFGGPGAGASSSI